MLSREEAARYVGVSVDVFDDEVRSGMWPRGTPRGSRGGRHTWDRRLLDLFADTHSGIAQPTQAAAEVAKSAVAVAGEAAWDRRLAELPTSSKRSRK